MIARGWQSVLWAVLLAALTSSAQAQQGIAAQPQNHQEVLVPSTDDRGFGDVIVPGKIVAGLHLIDSQLSPRLDVEHFYFGPVATPQGRDTLCLLMQTVNGRYRGRWVYGVFSATQDMTPRALVSEHASVLREKFSAAKALVIGAMGKTCESYTSDVLVATGFAPKPDTLEVILAMGNGFPTVRLMDKAGNPAAEMTCNLIDAPLGFRCRTALDPLAQGTYDLRVEVDLMNGRPPSVLTSQIVLARP